MSNAIYTRITTRTLVDAARYCYSAGGGSCEGCPLCDIFPGCIEHDLAIELADRIEALLKYDNKAKESATRLCDSCRYYTTNKSNY